MEPAQAPVAAPDPPGPVASVAYQMELPAWRQYVRHVAWTRRRTWLGVLAPIVAVWLALGAVAVFVNGWRALGWVPVGIVVSAVIAWRQWSTLSASARLIFRRDQGQTRVIDLFREGIVLRTANWRSAWYWSDLAGVERTKDLVLFQPKGYPADADAVPVPRAAFEGEPGAFERFGMLAAHLWTKGRALPPPAFAPAPPVAVPEDDTGYA